MSLTTQEVHKLKTLSDIVKRRFMDVESEVEILKNKVLILQYEIEKQSKLMVPFYIPPNPYNPPYIVTCSINPTKIKGNTC